MMDTIDALIAKGVRYSIKNPDEIVSLYKMYGETICRKCPGVIKKKFNELTKLKGRPMSKYRIKNGGNIDTTMKNDPDLPKGIYTNKNMTDDVAEKLIKGGYSSRFESVKNKKDE